MLEFIQTYWREGIWGLFLGGFIIQITPIKWNPYSWIAKKIGSALNHDLIKKIEMTDKKVDDIANTLNTHIVENERERIMDIRNRILAFSDDIRNGVNHSKERYDQILNEILRYNNYCADHPDFPNAAAIHAIAFIEEEYDLRIRDEKEFLS